MLFISLCLLSIHFILGLIMNSNKSVVLVIGHSFVQGFGKHIDIKRRDSHLMQSLESFATNYLRLSGKVDLVKYIGDCDG